jgi:hypothetical protein
MWRSRRGGETAPVDVTELQAQLVLLREENASLRVEQARGASVSRALERARLLQDEGLAAPSDGPQALAQALAVREAVVNLCREVEGALTAVRSRLTADDTGAELVEAPASLRVSPQRARPAGWSIDALRELVDEAASSIDPEWVEELQMYVHYLAEFARDGVVPGCFDALVLAAFGQLIELRKEAAA